MPPTSTRTPVSSVVVRALRRLGVLAVLLVCVSAPAEAQVCGDATGDGNVTVTDGVQTLRAAAFLSSGCTPAVCDVDGSGAVTVTDGVNVLRKAAFLSTPDACTGGGGGAAEVESVTSAVAPFLLFAGSAIADVDLPLSAAADMALPTQVTQIDSDDCPNGGVRRKVLLGCCIINVAFDACRYSTPTLGSFEFENTISVNFARFQVALAFTVQDVASGRLVAFDGTLDFAPSPSGGFVADGGPIRITTPQGAFDLSFQQLTFDDEGHLTGGAGQITDTDDNFDLQTVALTVTGPTTADVVATFDDGAESRFILNLVTGDFTPA